MPRGDGTGPMGLGPMTGKGMGCCPGNAAPGYANCGFGRGRGRGFRNMYFMAGAPAWARNGAYPAGFQGFQAGASSAPGTEAGATPAVNIKTGAAPAAEAAGDSAVTTGRKEALQDQIAFLKEQSDPAL